MMERHYDDDLLIGLLDAPVPADDPHLKSCRRCAETLHAYRAVADCLGEEAVWDLRELREEPDPQTVARLRAVAERIAREDADAERRVAGMRAMPRGRWRSLAGDPLFRTAGVVRKLLELCDETELPPADALEITALAVEIAEGLDEATWSGDTIPALRGAAWRERAWALFYVADVEEALVAATRARAMFERCHVADYDLARVDLTFALIYREMERIPEALALIDDAVAAFERFGDRRRVANALMTKAYVLSNVQNLEGALAVSERVYNEFFTELSERERASVISNIGSYAGKLGQHAKAIDAFRASTTLFADLGMEAELARSRWNVALLLRESQPGLAARELEGVMSEFDRLGMNVGVASVALDLVELRLAEGRLDEVKRLCQYAMEQFRRSNLVYTSRALTALGYLHEVAKAGAIPPGALEQVRNYLAILPREPARLFAPPPPSA